MILFKQFAGKERGLSQRDDLSKSGREGVGEWGATGGQSFCEYPEEGKKYSGSPLLQKVEEAGDARGGGGAGGGGSAGWEVHGPKEPK